MKVKKTKTLILFLMLGLIIAFMFETSEKVVFANIDYAIEKPSDYENIKNTCEVKKLEVGFALAINDANCVEYFTYNAKLQTHSELEESLKNNHNDISGISKVAKEKRDIFEYECESASETEDCYSAYIGNQYAEKALKTYKKTLDGELKKGTNEIPFWGDEVSGDNYKPVPFDSEKLSQKATEVGGGENYGITGEGVEFMSGKVENFVKSLSAIIFGLAVIMVTFAGFRYATSEGDERKTRQAKMQILTAGIGIGLAVFNLVILKMMKEVLGLMN